MTTQSDKRRWTAKVLRHQARERGAERSAVAVGRNDASEAGAGVRGCAIASATMAGMATPASPISPSRTWTTSTHQLVIPAAEAARSAGELRYGHKRLCPTTILNVRRRQDAAEHSR